jgi:hypothetical protein
VNTQSLNWRLSLQRDSFLSHGTALTVHGIAGPSDIVYVNREQSPKDRSNGITQAAMALAFRNKQRQSKYIFHHSAVKYMLLNGKHTGRAGVTRTKTPSGETVEVTDKERTLIDVVVRPAYAGGIERVADAYERSASGIDVDHTIDLLQWKRIRFLSGLRHETPGLQQEVATPLPCISRLKQQRPNRLSHASRSHRDDDSVGGYGFSVLQRGAFCDRLQFAKDVRAMLALQPLRSSVSQNPNQTSGSYFTFSTASTITSNDNTAP